MSVGAGFIPALAIRSNMCGIAGFYGFKSGRKADEKLIKKMCSAMVHRGPDDEGIYCKDSLGLGHRRLSIIDLEGGHQPMSNEDGSVWIVFNGEIYNFLDLEKELLQKGHKFRTRSDTEAIIHLYEEYGVDCLKKLNGMFAFAIWDEKKKSLFLARDRVGIKPLHYTISDGTLLFASEIKAILEDPSIKREIDYEALHDYLSLMYVPSPKTMFKGISKLPAGHYLICKDGAVTVSEYWDMDFSHVCRFREDEICDSLYSKLKTSVQMQLISDVTLGAFLSGGVDSSSVVSLMAGLQEKPVITNSIGFAEKAYNELDFARVVANKYKTDHHEYVVEPDALDIMEKLSYIYDEPFGDASAIPTYYVSKMARQNVKVALSGDGGDELFAGYPKYMYCAAAAGIQRSIPGFVKDGAKSISGLFSGAGANPWAMKASAKLDDLHLSPFDMYFKIISIFREEEKRGLYSEALKAKLGDYNSKDAYRKIFDKCKSEDYITKLQYLEIKTSLVDDMLTKVDRASMANSLEVRVPLLDHDFMEYTATIPSYFKSKGRDGKYIFKRAMERNLPPEILNRSKMGFSVPMEKWLRTDLKPMVETELFSGTGIVSELFDTEYIKKIWLVVLHNKIKGFQTADFAYRIWLLFIFSRWHKRFIGK